MPTGPSRFPHYNPDVPEDLKFLTESGAIWMTPYAQKGIDAIRSGAVKLADCKDVPAKFAAVLALPESRAAAPTLSLDAAPDKGWTCPNHGPAAVKTLTSRRGRVYGACTDCNEFERPEIRLSALDARPNATISVGGPEAPERRYGPSISQGPTKRLRELILTTVLGAALVLAIPATGLAITWVAIAGLAVPVFGLIGLLAFLYVASEAAGATGRWRPVAAVVVFFLIVALYLFATSDLGQAYLCSIGNQRPGSCP